MAVTKRPNPVVAQTERAAAAAEDMAAMAAQDPRLSTLAQRIADKKRALANKVKATRPYLIETDNAIE